MSEIYRRPVLIYSYGTEPSHKYNLASEEDPIRLSYHGKSHYNAVVSSDWNLEMRLLGSTQPGIIENEALNLASQNHQAHMILNNEAQK